MEDKAAAVDAANEDCPDDSKMISNYLSNISDANIAPLTLDDQANPFNSRASSSPTSNNHRNSDNRRISADLKLK